MPKGFTMCILNRYYDSKVLSPFAGKSKGDKVRFVFQQLVFKVP